MSPEELPSQNAPRKAGTELEPRFRVRVVIDGREHTLRPFLHNMLGASCMGLVEALKDVHNPGKLVIEVERV